jgi:hypothetical protein
VAATFEIPEPLFERIARLAAKRGLTPDEFVAEILVERADAESNESDVEALDAFIGCVETGDPSWAGTDTAELRRQAEVRSSA